ncbi:MAG TPA: tetratricopeptide repeat protein [Bryobacteraceae bacterium]|nr:tetratricopeptide repeat protein [Bryobacteraceae bacterium]
MFRRFLVYAVAAAAVLTLSPSHSSGASKEILELQRDVATLQDMVKAMQRQQDEKFSALTVLVQQSLNAANEASRSVAVIQSGFQQSLRDQESKVVTPVVGLSSRMDQMSTDLRTVQQAVSDLTGMISSLKSQLTDLNNAVKVLQTPPAPPPGTTTTTPGGTPGGAPEGPPPISSTQLYQNAVSDRLGGKFDLALQEFSDYLRWYGNTDMAPNAQFYIASIHASQGDYDNAVREYDMVIDKYPDNNKIPDAMFGKGQALIKIGRRTDAGQEFRDLIKRFPRSDLSNKACDQLKSMGLGCAVPRAGVAPRGGTRKK